MDELVLLDLCEVCVKPLVPRDPLVAAAEAGYHLPGDVLNNYLEAVDAYLL